MTRYSRGRGFTLVELLVVIAIIGTLVALLLPAVQGARESARRTSCQNNLRNLALACTQYHDSVGSFPSGWCNTHDPSTGAIGANYESWGWGALILPYLEQKNLHTPLGVVGTSLQSQLANNSAIAVPLLKTPLKIYICPSDTGQTGRNEVDTCRRFNASGVGTTASGAVPLSISVSNYVGVAGHLLKANAVLNTGIFYGDSYVRMGDILDGTSNTAMIGERDTLVCHSATWVGVQNPTGTGSRGCTMVTGYAKPKLNSAAADPTATGQCGTVWANGCGDGFSSLHVGGAQFAFADASVRFITNGIDWNYYPATGTAAANDHKAKQASGLPANGIYQLMMSRNDRIPLSIP